jgi:tetratricopeptide (TPR) repeat protein
MMTMVVLVLALTGNGVLAADKLPKPDLIPAPPTDTQTAAIGNGVALHDRGDYAGAITAFRRVLDENPWETHALYELSLSYSANKRYEDALATALLGARCKSAYLSQFHIIIGTSLENLGKTDGAVAVYRAAIKLNPRVALLHYNLASSLSRIGKLAEAKAAAEESLRYDPNQASSHLILAYLYQEMGYRIPAVLAYSRFLLLAPESQQATQAVQTLDRTITWGAGVTKGPDNENVINITVSKPGQKLVDEGDFATVEMAMSMRVAMDVTTSDKGKGEPASDFERLVHIYRLIGAAFANSKPKGGFAAVYYAPYFASLAKAGHVEAFVAYAWKAGQLPGASDWVDANPEKMAAFRAWSEQYTWPSR